MTERAESMDNLKLTPGDFLKNAGIVGFLRMWEFYMRRQGKPFVVTDDISVEELLTVDLPQLYIDVFIEYFGRETKTQQAFDRIDRVIDQLSEFLNGKSESIDRRTLKKNLKFIADSLTIPKSPKSGFERIQSEIENPDVYLDLKKKIKAPSPKEDLIVVCNELLPHLKELQTFCAQPKVRQTFLFETISNNIIKDRFWKGIAFLNSSNSKKTIPDTISKTFTEPFKAFLSKKEYGKNKPRCISCGMPMANKDERRSIAFVDMADDLERKTSAFWNCKPDAYLCPICAFLYSLSPLGFCQVDNGDFVFINANDSVQTLWANNQVKMDDEGKPLSYHARIDNAILQLLESKSKIQNNIQVATRVKQRKDQYHYHYRYHFNIIDRELIQLTQEKTVKSALKKLAERPSFKLSNDDYLNVYRLCVSNLLSYRNQFNLLYILVTESLKQSRVNVFLHPVFDIQCAQLSQKKEAYLMNLSSLQHFAAKAGNELRQILIADKVGRENVASIPNDKNEDIIRGIVYQLTNALKIQNVEQFADIIIRTYSSCKLPIPSVFLQGLRSGDQFAVVGYAFILGLKGAFYTNDNKEGEKTND